MKGGGQGTSWGQCFDTVGGLIGRTFGLFKICATYHQRFSSTRGGGRKLDLDDPGSPG